MKFWDASAIVPLLVAETTTPIPAGVGKARFGHASLVGIASGVRFGRGGLERGVLLDVKGAALAFDRLK